MTNTARRIRPTQIQGLGAVGNPAEARDPTNICPLKEKRTKTKPATSRERVRALARDDRARLTAQRTAESTRPAPRNPSSLTKSMPPKK